MKVLFISRPFTNPALGTGESNAAKNIVANLKKSGHEVDYVHKTYVKEHGTLLSILVYDYLFPLLLLIKSLVKKYDVVFFNTPPQSLLLPFFNLTVKHSVTLIFDLFCFDYYFGVFSRYLKLLYRSAFMYSDYVITVSEENRAKICALCGRDDINVIPLGVDNSFEALSYLSKKTEPKVGYIGKYNADFSRKRPEYLLEAINSTRNAVFYLANIVPIEFKQAIRLMEKRSVVYCGPISDEEKVGFFTNLCYLYFPSKAEGFGVPLIEAFWSSVLPIVHNDAKIPDSLKSHCYTIDSANKLNEVVDYFEKRPDEYRQKVKANYEYARDFSYSKYVSFLEDIAV